MIFFESFKFELRIFKLVGLRPVTVIESNLQKCVNLICIIITSIALGVLTPLYLAFYPHLASHGIISVLIYYGSLLPSLLMILTANGQCYFNNSTYQAIADLIGKVENISKQNTRKLSFQCVAFHYRLKIFFIYVLFFVSQGLIFTEVWFLDSQNLLSSFLVSLMRATHPLQLFHFVLYSDITTLLFRELNEEFKNLPICVLLSSKIQFLKYVKLMHMNLWLLVRKVNQFFGWNLLFTAMYLFIYVTHQFYWIFLSTEDKLDVLGLLEGLASLLYGMASLFILVNSCESCSIEVNNLIENVEQNMFWTSEDLYLHQSKQELLSQIDHLPINISACGFFTIDRKFLARVFASVSMYIVIFIQFFQSAAIYNKTECA